jgi:hypothetical protein
MLRAHIHSLIQSRCVPFPRAPGEAPQYFAIPSGLLHSSHLPMERLEVPTYCFIFNCFSVYVQHLDVYFLLPAWCRYLLASHYIFYWSIRERYHKWKNSQYKEDPGTFR